MFTKKSFNNGDFLLEYKGELIPHREALRREEMYKDSYGIFLYFFKNGQHGTMW